VRASVVKLWAWACATLPPTPAGYPYLCRTLTVPVGVERWEAFRGLLEGAASGGSCWWKITSRRI
jgi:hypothetical protein